jgi:hypothetical protein
MERRPKDEQTDVIEAVTSGKFRSEKAQLKGCPARSKVGRKWAQTIRTEELYDRFASVLIFKETPSREKHKTSFGV